ncbi:MAG: amidohydrolase family protein [Bradymonadales bacterium]|nr:amidohydrolase family protein [Bradymonadales bacterium]
METLSTGPVVDLHLHLFPHRLFEAVWDYFEQRGWPVHRHKIDQIERTLVHHGVSRAVALSYPHRPGVAHRLNRFMESVGDGHPLFLPFGSVHLEDEEFEACVRQVFDSPLLYGFKFQPLVQRFDVNHPRLDMLYQGCCERDFPILMHIGTGPVGSPHVGFAHCRRLVARYPQIRLCVAHMGAFEFDEFLRLACDHPRIYLDTAMINTRTDLFDNTFRGDPDLLERCADRVCFGSDWPNVPYSYQEALDSLDRFELPPESRPGLLGANALRFLKLVPPAE